MSVDISIADTVARFDGEGLGGSWVQHLSRMRRDFLGLMEEACQGSSGITCLRPFPGQRFLVVANPDLMQEVLVARAAEFSKSHLTRKMVGKFLGEGLLLNEGVEHAQHKKMFLGFFSGPLVHALGVITREKFFAEANRWAAAAKPIPLFASLSELTFDLFMQFILGDRATSKEAGKHARLSEAFKQLSLAMAGRFTRFPWPDWLPTANNRADRRAVAEARMAISEVLGDSSFIGEEANGEGGRALLASIKGRVQSGDWTMEQASDQLMTVLFAGHETTAVLLFWAIAQLAVDQDMQAELRARVTAEAEESIRTNRDGSSSSCSWLHAFMLETLRLYPPAWLFDRSPLKATTLGGTSILPKDVIYISPYGLHRNPLFFPQPKKFLLDRFKAGAGERAWRRVFIPFGQGLRACLGQTLATTQFLSAIGVLLGNFSWRSGENFCLPAAKASATLLPASELWVTFRRG